MNDFKQDITGLHAVVKPGNFYNHKATEKERTVVVLSGPGCLPDDDVIRHSPHFGHGRNIVVKLVNDKATDTISSYDLLYVIDKAGKKIKHFEAEF